ncbi:ribonucleoprotein PTB-binding 1-like [Ischnura elegans]|uniref:ribonucleoprotein PTB-binding 1-like n=1 Tax=Ischnura elegans TaxID=197161 RepID=UPI001ED86A88|nr:ribonucleoprotein PTB-binding 1-like [Ischnura elegans]
MAAGSTETFASPAAGIACFNDDLLKSSPDKFWTGEVVATASTGGFWEDDPEENVKRRVNELKRKFHQGRTLIIKHLPRDATEDEVRELLSDFPVQSVVMLGGGAGSPMARVALEDPEMLDEWDRERVFLLRGQRLPVVPAPTDHVLCVARLPLHFTEEQFTCLVCCCGEVSRSFLMISEKTGESKGYGFVEYTTKESALHAKSVLDGKQVENWVLYCDWLDSSHVTFESLHSKCLYVDQLPQDFRDMGEFRKVFSSVVNPPYCQIALKNGCPQNWGLVEYNSAEDAEHAQVSLNGYQLKGKNIRISYYIPGVRAINLYLKLLNDSGGQGKSALLPDPPAPAVFQQLQNLAKQNPIFAQNLQYIILTQILSLQSKSNGGDNQKKEVPNNAKGAAAPSNSGAQRGPVIPGMGEPCSEEGPGAPMRDNARAALVILLAAQMQAQMGNNHPSLLGNPQMLAMLQGLLKQNGSMGPPPSAPGPSGMGEMPPGPQSTPPPYPFAQGHIMPSEGRKIPVKNGFVKGLQKVPLLPNPTTSATSPPPDDANPPGGPPFGGTPAKDSIAATVLSHEPLPPSVQDVASFWNGLLMQLQNQSNLNPEAALSTNKNGIYDLQHLGINSEGFLLSEDVQGINFPVASLPPHGKVSLPQSHPFDSSFPDSHNSGDLQQTITTLLDNAHNLNRLLGNLTNAMQSSANSCGLPMGGNRPLPAPHGLSAPPRPPTHLTYPFPGGPAMGAQPMAMPDRLLGAVMRSMHPRCPQADAMMRRSPQADAMLRRWPQLASSPSAMAQQRMPGPRSPMPGDMRLGTPPPPPGGQPPPPMAPPPHGHAVLAPPMRQRSGSLFSPHLVGHSMLEPMGYLDMKGGGVGGSGFGGGWAGSPGAEGSFLNTSPGPQFRPMGSPPGGMIPGLWAHPGTAASLLGSPPPGALVSPAGQKRKYEHILPSPEASPEGSFVGQHSQGLGGHYADSYFKRKKKN